MSAQRTDRRLCVCVLVCESELRLRGNLKIIMINRDLKVFAQPYSCAILRGYKKCLLFVGHIFQVRREGLILGLREIFTPLSPYLNTFVILAWLISDLIFLKLKVQEKNHQNYFVTYNFYLEN